MTEFDKYAYVYCHNYNSSDGTCILTGNTCEDEENCELRKAVETLDEWND